MKHMLADHIHRDALSCMIVALAGGSPVLQALVVRITD